MAALMNILQREIEEEEQQRGKANLVKDCEKFTEDELVELADILNNPYTDLSKSLDHAF